MTESMSLIAELLHQIETAPEQDMITSVLGWLGHRCKASCADLTVTSAFDDTTLRVTWPASSMPGAASQGPVHRIALGQIEGGAAELVLGLGNGPLAQDDVAALENARPILRLLAERHQLRCAASRLRDLASLWGTWLWETDGQGRVAYLSADLAGTEMFQKARGDRTDSYRADIKPDDWSALSSKMALRLPFRNLFHAITLPDGQKHWLRSSGIPRHDADGSFLGYSGISAERNKPAEQEHSAIAAYDRLTAILDVLPDLVFEITADGRYTDFLAGPADLMGNARQNLPGKTLEDVLPADLAARTRAALEQTLKTSRSPPERYRLASPLGMRWYERAGARKAPTGPGEDPTAIFVVRDVTEDMEQADELRRLGRVVETMSNLVVIIDREQRITWVNRAWENRTGWTLSEVMGQDLSTVVRGNRGEATNAEMVASAIARNAPYHGETVNFNRHGTAYWIDFNILPLMDAEGRINGYVSVETDITAQKEGEARAAQLADEADRMRAQLNNAIETLPDGVLIWDQDDRLIFANSAYKRMYPEVADALVLGVSQADILQIGIRLKAFPSAIGREEDWLAEQWERYRNPCLDEVYRSDGRWIRRLDLRTPDGGRIAVRIDTTERRKQLEALDAANQSLAEARGSLAQIIESADVGTWDWNVDSGALRIGGRYAQMLGYSPEELGEPSDEMFRSLVHPDDLARLDTTEDDDFSPLPDGREPVREHQLRMRRKDGTWAWILSRSAVTDRLPDGRHKTVVGIHLDVTERKRLEDLVISNQRFLNEVMDTSISAIVVMDAQGVITYANAEAEHILGLTKDTIQGRKYDDPAWHITETDGSPMPTEALPFLRAHASGESVRDARMAVEWPDGTRRILSVNAVPHAGLDGTNADQLIITSFVDITEDLNKASRLEQALVEAQAASQSKSTFLATMSHEIRTPLNGVLGMAEMLEGLIDEPRKREMIGTIRRSGELLLNVLNEILDMSKIEAGKMVIEEIPFTPAEVARQIEPLHALRAEEKGLDFEVLTNAGAERPRIGDSFRIQQILNNLLSNAIKFTEAGSISLTLSAREGKPLVIEVRDTGIGMSPEQLSRVFNNFEQAEGGTTRRFGGTGLGMAIVHSLVRLMGGDITVTSNLGQGTSVKITLPLPETVQTVVTEAITPDVPQRYSLCGVSLLIADDSATNRMVISEMLKDTGATLILATNGAEAVSDWTRLAEAQTPADMLILDIAMPVLDGIGALQAIRNATPAGAQVPAIAVTANAMSHQVSEYIMAGFDSHVAKPFRQAELLHAISTLLPPR
ncbi:MAG: PAS domain S-box protein [Paracoccaceae bacterium]